MRTSAFLKENTLLKLLSLFSAIVLWLFVTLETGDETVLPLRISYLNVPPGYVLRQDSAAQPLVRISGPRILLVRQKWRGAMVTLDVAGASPGKLTFSGLEKHVMLVPGVQAVNVAPVTHESVLVRQ